MVLLFYFVLFHDTIYLGGSFMNIAIIFAGGTGQRMGSETPKQLVNLIYIRCI